MPPERPGKKTRPVIALAGIGTEMVGFTLLGVLLDWWADSMPVFTALLTVTGLAVAMWHLMTWSKARGAP